ncbi:MULTISPECIES: putative bifunctional diguanylate cyclase/phosphodiesterase [unclassified Sphingomonas]|uniref:putative bifunctional diguanylate cyclase/phosphodiesterase n=1 Tax=unclassified Sphingomonas TaxID=196159 RepID=UPI002151C40E|nr:MULTISPECIES: EAL domain-containing protein [unclassified Sphingomonas]MCR5869352.1 EAL domain-containing protein [Sphingomonas sp. J344]UUX98918.1 EAL domain-containing protein [Sphingomonas sp. J315]
MGLAIGEAQTAPMHRPPLPPAASNAQSLPLAQYEQLRRQIPWLYLLLFANAGTLAISHGDTASRWIAQGIPLILVGIAVLRMIHWLRAPTPAELSEAEAARRNRRTQIVALAIGGGFTIWVIALDWFSAGAMRGHVAVALAVTLLSCMLCLMHVPRAAAMLAAAVVTPYALYCLSTGSLPAIFTALNIALVTAVMSKILIGSNRMFVDLVQSQQALRDERSQASRLSDENQLLAQTDSLTGLPNRRHFFARLDACLTEREANGRAPFCVGVLDLDRFKPINDTFGHATGDRLLSELGRRLSGFCGEELMIARLGGDEFGILIDGDASTARARLAGLRETICAPMMIHDASLRVGCSIGLAVYPDAGRNAHALFDRSDYALYHAKSHERGECVIFSAEHEAMIRDELQLEAAFRAADLSAELSLLFQPIYETRSMTLASVEALARWHSPQLGLVMPDRLIAMAERLGLINQVTLILFAKLLAKAERLPTGVGVSFNLSVHDIASPETIRELTRMIVASGIEPARLTFEITETTLMSDIDGARTVLEQLRALGVRVALDDFGTGYSSLGILHQIPLDILKVDRSFAAGMTTQSGRAMIAAIRGLAHSLSLDCVIEGIETEAQLMEASLLGCRYAQGYLLGRPAPMGSVLRGERETAPVAMPAAERPRLLPAATHLH